MSGRSQWAISCKDKLLSKWSTLLTVLFARASMCRSKTSNCHAQHGWWNKSLAIKCMQNVWMNAYMYEWLNVWMSGCLNVWMFECSSVWLFECLHVWMFECLDVWMFGCSNVWTFECLSVWWFECLNTSEYVWIRLNTSKYVWFFCLFDETHGNISTFMWRRQTKLRRICSHFGSSCDMGLQSDDQSTPPSDFWNRLEPCWMLNVHSLVWQKQLLRGHVEEVLSHWQPNSCQNPNWMLFGVF